MKNYIKYFYFQYLNNILNPSKKWLNFMNFTQYPPHQIWLVTKHRDT